jgi:hypothetical protein
VLIFNAFIVFYYFYNLVEEKILKNSQGEKLKIKEQTLKGGK